MALNNLKNTVLNEGGHAQNHTHGLIPSVGSSRKDRTRYRKKSEADPRGVGGKLAVMEMSVMWVCALENSSSCALEMAFLYSLAAGKSVRSILSNSCNDSLAQVIKD